MNNKQCISGSDCRKVQAGWSRSALAAKANITEQPEGLNTTIFAEFITYVVLILVTVFRNVLILYTCTLSM